MPSHSPITVDEQVDRPSSSTVGQIRSPMTSETGRLEPVRDAEVAAERFLHVVDELLVQRLAEAEALAQDLRPARSGRGRLRVRFLAGSPGSTRNRKKLNTSTKARREQRPRPACRAEPALAGAAGGSVRGRRRPPAARRPATPARPRSTCAAWPASTPSRRRATATPTAIAGSAGDPGAAVVGSAEAAACARSVDVAVACRCRSWNTTDRRPGRAGPAKPVNRSLR